VRGKGLLVGVEFSDPDVALLASAEAIARGVIFFFSLNRPEVVRLAPPLIVEREHIEAACAALDGALEAVAQAVEQAAG
jgi:putrescine aminotransferase